MKRRYAGMLGLVIAAGMLALAHLKLSSLAENAIAGEPEKSGKIAPEDMASSAREARGRAKLLHECIHGSLQYVHREYFREDEGLAIPAVTMKSVFRDLAGTRGVKVRWLAVNARAMSVDHEPADAFEKEAAKLLGEGKDFHEAVESDTYRYAGAISLHAECLKCHLPARSSNKPRAAAVVISMPIREQSGPAGEK